MVQLNAEINPGNGRSVLWASWEPWASWSPLPYSSMGSSFQRQGAAYRKERLVIFKEDRLGGRVRVTVEEERVP